MTRRAVAALGVVVSLVVATSAAVPVKAQQEGLLPPPPVTWLDLGDSYASGEGTTAAVGTCQRSDRAYGPVAAAILRAQRSWTVAEHRWVACTGDLFVDVLSSRDAQRAAGADAAVRGPGADIADGQSQIDAAIAQGLAADGRVDVITISAGGNDTSFSDVVIGCLALDPGAGEPWPDVIGGGCDVEEEVLERRIDAVFDGGSAPPVPPGSPTTLTELYRRLVDERLTPDGVLVVVGYPRLLTPSRTWGRWRGATCNSIAADDADMLGRLAERLDLRMREAVAEADGGSGRIVYVSRLTLFDASPAHSLCGVASEWINSIGAWLRDGSGRYQRAFHPNDLGHQATAERVAAEVEAHLGVEPPPSATSTTARPSTTTTAAPRTTTTAERVVRGGASFDPGDDFSARCTVAWPTAPMRSTSSVTIRTTCAGVPSQFQFVDITYPDPDLPVTPARPTVQVEGEVVDVSRSEFGFTVLVVVADDIEVL